MRSGFLKTTLAAALAVTALLGADQQASTVAAAAIPNDDKTIVHVLNRIGFGPRPGDIEKVRATGLQAYIDQQLRPEGIPDGSMEARLAGLVTLGLSSREISEQFAQPVMQARRERQRAAANQAQPQAEPPRSRMPCSSRPTGSWSELGEQKVLRAVYSERQLQEVLTDFWFNHFNVDARKGQRRFMLTEYERDAIRPHVFGKFPRSSRGDSEESGDALLSRQLDERDPNGPRADQQIAAAYGVSRGSRRGAAAPHAPAANSRSPRRTAQRHAERPQRELRPRADGAAHARRGRRLHAEGRHRSGAGVHGLDDSEPAAWAAAYAFDPRIHDRGEKIVLGHVIKAGGGEEDGEQVLDILADASFDGALHLDQARAPLRQRHAAAGARRSPGRDVPADRRRPARGDADAADARRSSSRLTRYRAKVKTPFEFVVSAVRATRHRGAGRHGRSCARVQQLGMPLYMCQPPTGYKDTADAWVNTGRAGQPDELRAATGRQQRARTPSAIVGPVSRRSLQEAGADAVDAAASSRPS